MPFMRFPSAARAVDMLIGAEPDWWSTWTPQPGSSDVLHALVTGAAPPMNEREEVLAEQAVAAAVKKAPVLVGGAHQQHGQGIVKLRPYQLDCCAAIQNAWTSGSRAPLVVLPTGAGKTLVASEMIARVRKATSGRCLFFAHRKELLDQTATKVRLVSPDTRVGLIQAKFNEIGRPVTVASIQTLGHKGGKRLEALLNAGSYELMILDEAHHAVSKQWLRVIEAIRQRNPGILVMGMTATPGREDGLALDRIFDTVAYERNLLDMIQEGWLVPPRGFRVKIDVRLDEVRSDGGDYVVSQLSKVMNTPHVNRAVVEAWMTYGHDRKCLVFACDVEHASALAQEFRDAGYPALHVDGTMKPKQRKEALDAFREGSIKLLVNCNVLTEGYDDPSAEGIVFARPTQSQALYIQAMGRALRLFPGKTEALIIDCVGNSEKHRPIQLASLVGFDPKKGRGPSAAPGEGDGEEDEVILEPTVADAEVRDGHEFSISKRVASTKYKWRETTHGWVLQIPRIGYYLVAWSDKARSASTIRFYDQRDGRKNTPPREVVREPITFEMAYGLVEAEADRLFRASEQRNDMWSDEQMPLEGLVDLDEGVDDDLHVPESWVLKNAEWRSHPITYRQRELLLSLGVKGHTMPELAGEASDLITIMRVERDVKMRLPATEKQLAYFKRWKMTVPENLTKGAAAKLIYEHRVSKGFQEPRRRD